MRQQGLNLRLFGVWLVLCAIWSSTWIFIKLGLHDLPPVWFACVRFIIASAALTIFNLCRGASLPRQRRDWLLIAATGFMIFAVNYGLLFWGEQRISSGLSAVLQATIPAFGLVFAHLHLPGERLTPPKIGGVALGLVGVGIIFSNQLGLAGPKALWGSVAIVFGAMSAAYSNVLIKAHGKHLDPAVLATGQMFCGWLPLLVLGFLFEGNPLTLHWTRQAIFDLCYLALMGSSLAFCLLYWLTRRVEVTKILLISLVTPVAAVIIDAVVLHEKLPTRSMLGGLCVLLAIGLTIYRPAARIAPVAAEALEG